MPDSSSEAFDKDTLVSKVQRRAQQYRDEEQPRVAAPYFPQAGGWIP